MIPTSLFSRVFSGKILLFVGVTMLISALAVCGRNPRAALAAEPASPPATQTPAAKPQTMPSGARSGNTPATGPATREARLPAADRAKVLAVRAELSGLAVALSAFEIDTVAFPTTEQGLAALVRNPGVDGWRGPYVNKVPLDPWGHPYIYRAPGANGRDFDLISAGPDGKEGGGDDIKRPED